MRRLALVLALVAGSLLAAGAPADAHQPNGYAALACGGTRAGITVTHAHPVDLQSTHVTASCIGVTPGYVWTWRAIIWWNGEITLDSPYHRAPIG